MNISILMLLHEATCLALFASVFCRFVRTTCRTKLGIRLAFWLMGMVALVGMAMPLLGGVVSWFSVAMTCAVLAVQWVTSHYWHQGTPHEFCALEGEHGHA